MFCIFVCFPGSALQEAVLDVPPFKQQHFCSAQLIEEPHVHEGEEL
jgi:hypothetical protein